MLFAQGGEDPNYQPPPEERPGGFAWGQPVGGQGDVQQNAPPANDN